MESRFRQLTLKVKDMSSKVFCQNGFMPLLYSHVSKEFMIAILTFPSFLFCLNFHVSLFR